MRLLTDDRILESSSRTPSDNHNNSFDSLRMIGAIFVFVGHEFGMDGYSEPAFGSLQIALASLGLYIFFGISGYLVFGSLRRNPGGSRFFNRRLRRIVPGWVVNVLFCFFLGAALTDLSLISYLVNSQTRNYLMLNLSIMIPPTQFVLPGLFSHSRWPIANGSIWTVKYEILCYVVLFGLQTLVHKFKINERWFYTIAAALCIGLYIVYTSVFERPDGEQFFGYYNWFNLLRFLMAFMAGVLYAVCEPISDVSRLVCVMVLCGLLVFPFSDHFLRAGMILLLVVSSIELGRSRVLFWASYSRLGDLSYGFYLYAYPIQNYFTSSLMKGSSLSSLIVVSFFATIIISCASWQFVERPFLRLKG